MARNSRRCTTRGAWIFGMRLGGGEVGRIAQGERVSGVAGENGGLSIGVGIVSKGSRQAYRRTARQRRT
jgi:hypothetical protein